MICYKDMTFCSSDCTNRTCHRFFSDDIKRGAEMWWGGPDAPVAFSDFSGDCPDYEPLKFQRHDAELSAHALRRRSTPPVSRFKRGGPQ